ncbi:hypothetical protein KC363_g6183 [Hortaea werneckii]|nr:hypothetical protein KC361_g4495 [Hortaea werneckii]KAI6884884.1 hypothetical protein KC325_g3974 [Hortaea werneckii]KAI6994481.1 hypothetical protein KC359_g4599 [Hortaea werneckii]KAI7086922.1 hypothetical protein KC356_g4622 [Hortaea werneckii]KAI7146363.1 hypothetical protein KC344_g3698 [Hortaea werneckii]
MRPSVLAVQGDEFPEDCVSEVVPANPGVLLLQAAPVHRRAREELGEVSAGGEGEEDAGVGVGVVFELEVGDGGSGDGVLGWEADDQTD